MPRLALVALVALVACLAACGDGADWDGVLAVTYGERALGRHVKRRIRLLTAGVVLRGDLAPDTVWADALGYTFIGRHSQGEETDIRGVRPMRNGIRVRDEGGGLSRTGPALYRLDEGWTMVDVFDPRGHYVASAAVGRGMAGRRILQHLGVTRRHCARCDRLFLPQREVELWRELLPVVIQSRGFGFLYTRPIRDRDAEATAADTTELFAERFALEEVAGYVLVGKERGDQRYCHVFAPGGEYRVTAVQHGAPYLAGRELLAHLGFALE